MDVPVALSSPATQEKPAGFRNDVNDQRLLQKPFAASIHTQCDPHRNTDDTLSSEPEQQTKWPGISLVAPHSVHMLLHQRSLLETSPLLRHIPVLLWLVEIIRPRRFVQVGMGDPVALFATCRAMEKTVPYTECEGVGLDAISSADAERLHLYAKSFHPQTVRLDGRVASQWAGERASDRIDLLFLDLEAPSGTDALAVDWARLISPRGVVLILGSANSPDTWPVIEKLAGARPTIAFEECGGFRIILYGPEQAAELSRLAALEPGSPTRVELSSTIFRLGSMTWTEVAAEALQKIETLQQRLREVGAELSPMREENVALRTRLDALLKAYDDRTAVIADVQARLFDADTQIERLTNSADEANLKQAQALARRDSALAAARAQIDTLTLESDDLRAQASRRDAEIVALTRRLDLLLSSTSWKITAPARSIARLMHRRQ